MRYKNDSINAILELERQRLEIEEYDRSDNDYTQMDYIMDRQDAERDDF